MGVSNFVRIVVVFKDVLPRCVIDVMDALLDIIVPFVVFDMITASFAVNLILTDVIALNLLVLVTNRTTFLHIINIFNHLILTVNVDVVFVLRDTVIDAFLVLSTIYSQ